MKILHYDCFAGISGDMNLAAMIDLGVDVDVLRSQLEKLQLDGWRLNVRKDYKNGIFGTAVDVVLNTCDAANAGVESDGHNHCCHSDGVGDEHCHSHSHNHCDDNSCFGENAESCECACEHSHAYTDEVSHAHSCCHSHSHADDESCVHGHSHAHTHEHTHEHRAYADIKKLIEASALSPRVKRDSLKIFEILAQAEAQVHGKSVDEVHFHEVGAVDSIIDTVGAAICLEILGVEKIIAEPVELGGGTVKCAHGILPIPAPATALLSKKFPSKLGGASHECTTPTGAAIIAALADGFCEPIEGRCLSVGVGVGHRDCVELPNILRVELYDSVQESSVNKVETLFELASNIDDMTSEEISFLCDRLFEAGARDVWQESIVMKKNRLAVKVCALTDESSIVGVREAYFKFSSTLGVREARVCRSSITRKVVCKNTRFGEVRFKVSQFGERKFAKPESDDCARIAKSLGESFKSISKKLLDDFGD